MTHTTQVLSDEQIQKLAFASEVFQYHPGAIAEFARSIESATLKAVSVQEPVAWQCRFKENVTWSDCSKEHHDWVKRCPHEFIGYETRTLYTLPPAQPAPVDDKVIAGVLFDFMGWLTSRKQRIVLSSSDNASPAVDAIEEFAKMRGIDISNAAVLDWQARAALQCAQAPQPTKGQP